MFQLLKLTISTILLVSNMYTSPKYFVKVNKIYSILNPVHHIFLGSRLPTIHFFFSFVCFSFFSLSNYDCSSFTVCNRSEFSSALSFVFHLHYFYHCFDFFFLFLFISSLICFHPITNGEYKTNVKIFLQFQKKCIFFFSNRPNDFIQHCINFVRKKCLSLVSLKREKKW